MAYFQNDFLIMVRVFTLYERFEVSTAATVTNGLFWDITPCASCKKRRFGEI
jgi:hypothetical protein